MRQKTNVSAVRRRRLAAAKTSVSRAINSLENQRWVIRYQWRRDHPNGPVDDWRSWRHFAVVPILFHDRAEAERYLNATAFKNMPHHRKPSASVNSVWLKRPFATIPGGAEMREAAAAYHDAKAAKWRKEASRHTRPGGRRSDHEEHDLERAKRHEADAAAIRKLPLHHEPAK